jgi:integrase
LASAKGSSRRSATATSISVADDSAHGKGGKIRHTPIPTEELREELAELSLRRDPQEHLLYPQKRGPKGTVIWENPRKPLSGPALHRWWYRCLARAGVVDEGTTHGKKMHGARYTSGTEF